MNELAQLPTPTIATRTLPSSGRPLPLLCAPLVLVMRKRRPPGCETSAGRGNRSRLRRAVPLGTRAGAGGPGRLQTPYPRSGYTELPFRAREGARSGGVVERAELPADVPDPLEDREGGQRDHRPDR